MLINTLLENGRGAVSTIGAEAKLAEVAALLAAQHIDVVVVCDSDHKVKGVIADIDIMRRIASCKGSVHVCDVCDVSAAEVMTQQVVTCTPGDNLNRVRALMADHGLRRIPIVDDNGRFVGLVSLREVLLHQYEATRFIEDELEHYVFGVGYQ